MYVANFIAYPREHHVDSASGEGTEIERRVQIYVARFDANASRGRSEIILVDAHDVGFKRRRVCETPRKRGRNGTLATHTGRFFIGCFVESETTLGLGWYSHVVGVRIRRLRLETNEEGDGPGRRQRRVQR